MSVSAFFTNVMFSFLFFPFIVIPSSAQPFGRHLQLRLFGREPTWNFEDCHERKLLWKSFSLLSAERGSSGFHSQRQHKLRSPRPRPWYSCLFLISDTSRCMRAKNDSAFYSAGLSKTHFKCMSSACVTEYKIMFYKSSPEGRTMFFNENNNKKCCDCQHHLFEVGKIQNSVKTLTYSLFVYLNILKSCAGIELKQISTSCLSVSSAASRGFWSMFNFGFIDVFFYCNYVWEEEHEGATLNNEQGNSIRAFCWLV